MAATGSRTAAPPAQDGYKWVALANTTAAVFMSQLDGSILLIAMPAIFVGIHLDPLAPGNIAYLLWLIMGYRLVQAVLVVTVGRLGDMYGRVRIYNAGFAVFTVASVMLSIDPFTGAHGALWLIGWRVPQAIGGSMLTANSAAILTDAFPAEQRGFALGTNQVAGLAGMFIGLIAGGVLASLDWRAVFWVNVPVGIFGTVWAYLKLRETGQSRRSPIDWWGNVSFAVGLSAILAASTYGIQPYGGHTMGWTDPWVIAGLAGGAGLLVAFVAIERRVTAPMVNLALFRLRAFTAGNLAGFSMSLARGGLQFMLVIWLQGIWLPLHGYSFSQTPLWAGIYMLPLTVGFLIAGPVSGTLSDRIGSRGLATGGALAATAAFVGLTLLPVNFPYLGFALLLALVGVATGMFASPNSSSIMGSVPASERGVASGMRATFQNSGTAISIGIFFTLVIAGVASSLPGTLNAGLLHQGVPAGLAHRIAGLPPVSSLFGALLGVNPLEHLLAQHGALHFLSAAGRRALTGRAYFPHLISSPFHDGLIVVFLTAAGLSALAALASLLRGGRPATVPPHEGAHSMTTDAPEAINPLTTALLVLDYQNGTLERVPDAGRLLAGTTRAIDWLRARGGHIGFVRVGFAEGEAPTATMGRRIGAEATRTMFDADAPATQLHDDLDPQPDDIVVRKTRVGPFAGTDLDARLRAAGVDTLLLAGISTSGAVLSAVRDAHDRDYRLIVLSDLCADPEPDVHDFLLARVLNRQAELVTSAELPGLVQ